MAAHWHEQGRVLRGALPDFSSFRYWLRKSRSASVDVPALPPAIVPLPLTLAPKPPSIGLLVGNRYALDIPADFDEAMRTKLLAVLPHTLKFCTPNGSLCSRL